MMVATSAATAARNGILRRLRAAAPAGARRAGARGAAKSTLGYRRGRENACRTPRDGPSAWSVRMRVAPEPGHVARPLPGKRPVADNGVAGVRVDVEDRRVVQRHAHGSQLGSQGPGETLDQVRHPPLRPSAAIGGHSVNGDLSRATRPPSWSMADPEREVGHEAGAALDRDSSATCPGSATFRAKRMTPPRPNSRASERNSTGS